MTVSRDGGTPSIEIYQKRITLWRYPTEEAVSADEATLEPIGLLFKLKALVVKNGYVFEGVQAWTRPYPVA